MVVVTIIVPVYNTEEYIGDCIDSVLAQSFTEFEVILINDGSSDNSLKICREYSARDSRIKILDKKNGGVSSARNLGLDHACGDYILFLDSDDIIPPNCLSLHLKYFSDGVDQTLGAMDLFTGDTISYTIPVEHQELKTITDSLRDFVPNGKQDWHRYMVNRLLKSSVIKNGHLRFNENIAYKEDGVFLVQYLLRCKGKVAYIPEVVYRYRQNPDSAMGALSSGSTEKLITNIDAHALIIKEMRADDVPGDILGKEIRHAFQSRRWVLDKLFSSKYYHKAWLQTLYKLLLAVGFATSVKIAFESTTKKTKNLLFHR